jgi:hypothetical protein
MQQLRGTFSGESCEDFTDDFHTRTKTTASCTTQIISLGEDAGLQSVIIDVIFIHNCDM